MGAPEASRRHEWICDPAPGEGRRVRREAAERLRRWAVDEPVVEIVQIVVEELVANAVDHARSAFRVGLSAHDGGITVEVHDASPDTPVLRPVDTSALRGRGLLLVESLSASWGYQLVDRGKRVWAQVAAAS